MNIPTKQHITKHRTLMIGGLAAVVGLAAAPAAVTYAHGANSERKNGNHSQHDKRRDGGERKKHSSSNHDYDSLSKIDKLSADDFTAKHTKHLKKLDTYVEKNNLTIENGKQLRTGVVTQADAVASELTRLSNLRASIETLSDTSPEQRAELKLQLQAAFGAYYDYKFALYDYTAGIKAAAKAGNVDTKRHKELDATIQ